MCDTVDLDDNTGFLVDFRAGAAAEFLSLQARTRPCAGLPVLLLTLGLWLACVLPARADGQIWVLASVTKTLAVDWRLNVDFAPRWERDASDYSRNVLRAEIARALGKQVAVGFGYEFTQPAVADRQARASHLGTGSSAAAPRGLDAVASRATGAALAPPGAVGSGSDTLSAARDASDREEPPLVVAADR